VLELFPELEEAPRPWSVTRLNREVRSCLEGVIGQVWVEGEISNLRRQPSGHQYFSLKDEACQVSCVLFRGAGSSAPALRDGMQVELHGQIGVYEPRGQYQIVVRRVQPRGAGELEAKLRALQEKLRAEGLFDAARKRQLPPHPSRVGVVTSPSGAAICDFLQILRRRAPHLAVFIAPVRVQGRGAVISAVGHEIDHTTSDLAADVRAPTPSAAAEILSADRAETLQRLAAAARRLTRETENALALARAHLAQRAASGVFLLPARRIADLRQLVDDLSERADASVVERIARLRLSTRHAASVLQAREPSAQIAAAKDRLGDLARRQTRAVEAGLTRRRQHQTRTAHALELLGPRQTLERGFTMTLDTARRPLTSARKARSEEKIVTVFADGEIVSRPES